MVRFSTMLMASLVRLAPLMVPLSVPVCQVAAASAVDARWQPREEASQTERRTALRRASGVVDASLLENLTSTGTAGGNASQLDAALPCTDKPADVCTHPINPDIPQPCYRDETCSAVGVPRDILGCNAGGAGQNCRYCGFKEFNGCPEQCIDFSCPREASKRQVTNARLGMDCDEASCTATDPWAPNCRGQNFTCLAGQTQAALGNRRAFGATYNNFGMPNTGFCAMQKYRSSSRYESEGPKLLTTGRIFSGVGLSQAQFGNGLSTATYGMGGDGQMACGMCLEVTAAMPKWNCELTKVENEVPIIQKLIVMVMDQCNDQWTSWSEDGTTALGNCVTGHLDFDVYTSNVGDRNIRNVTWRAVDCPVGDLPITVVFSSGPTVGSGDYFAFHLWDLKVPVEKAEVQCKDGHWEKLSYYPNGFNYAGACGTLTWPAFHLRLTSVHGEVVNRTVDFEPSRLKKPTQEDIVYLPPVSLGTQFSVSYNPPSADANAKYKACLKTHAPPRQLSANLV